MTVADLHREFRQIPIGLIDAPELAARTSMDDEALEDLARDIRRKGLLLPIIVLQRGERYEVVAGHRRRVASERAGLVSVPCFVYEDRDRALEGVKYSENRFREELSPADEALLFSELLERDCGGDVDKLCEQLGEKRTYVEGRLSLFQGDQDVFEALRSGHIKIGVAHALNKCTDQDIRRSFLHSAVHGGATVAMVSGWVQQWQYIADSTPRAATPAAAGDAPAPVPADDPFKCIICGRNDHAHTIKFLAVHGHCQLAILSPMLEAYRGPENPGDRG